MRKTKTTVQEILDPFGDNIPEAVKKTFAGLSPQDEFITKQIPDRLLQFEEGEPAMIGVMSDLRKDRDDEVLLPEGMDDSSYSGVMTYNHDYYRIDIPHARSMWRKKNPKDSPYEILAKTLYLTELSDLGWKVYEYRKAGHPLGQSHGFRGKERISRGQTGYDEVYKDWVKRCKAMLKAKKIKPVDDEFSEPRCFYTKWEVWEIADVFVGSNPDALQEAVNKGILKPEEAKSLVAFDVKTEDVSLQPEPIGGLLQRLTDLEVAIEEMKAEGFVLRDGKFVIPRELTQSISEMWGTVPVEQWEKGKSIQEMWDENTA